MTKLFQIGAMMAIVLALSAVVPGTVSAQQTTTTAAGSPDASITTSRTTQAPQTRPTPRPSPGPVTPVRPLSEEDRQRQEASSAGGVRKLVQGIQTCCSTCQISPSKR